MFKGKLINKFNKLKLIFFFWLLYQFNYTVAQDSLKNNYYKAIKTTDKLKTGIAFLEKLKYENPNQTLIIADSLFALTKQSKLEYYNGELFALCGAANWHNGNLKQSNICFNYAYEFNIKSNKLKDATTALNNIGYNYFELGDYTKALFYLNKALLLGKKINDTEILSITNTYIGQINVKLKKYSKAILYYKESITIFKKSKKYKNEAIVYNNIGNIYLEQNKSDSALYWFNNSLALSTLKQYPKGIAMAASNVGLTYLDKKNYSKANVMLNIAYNIYDSLNNTTSLVTVCINLARLNSEINNTDLALSYASKAEKLAIEIGSNEQLYNLYNMLSKLYNKKTDYQTAFKYSALQLQYADSLANENAQRIQNEMTARFETESLNDKITLLTTANKLKDTEIIQKKIRQNFFVFGIVAFLVIIALLFFVIKNKTKTQKQLQLKNNIIQKSLQEREILLKEIHHRVKNNLQIISSLLSLQGGYGSTISTDELIKQSESRINSMALIHEKLYQTQNLKDINLSDYLTSFVEQLASLLLFKEKNINYKLEIESINLDIDKLVPLGLIINELVTNAIKHAFKNKQSGNLLITGTFINQTYSLTLSDDGLGLPKDFNFNKAKTLGLKLINGLSNQLKADLSFTTSSNGSNFNIILKNIKSD